MFYIYFFFLFFSIYKSRYSVQEKILRNRNDEDRYSVRSTANKLNGNELYDPNQNKHYKLNGNMVTTKSAMASPMHHNGNDAHFHHNDNVNGNRHNGNMNGNNTQAMPSPVIRERYQHPALAAIINESQGIKFRGERK